MTRIILIRFKMKNNNSTSLTPEGRLLSLDFFRGLTMFLLIAEFAGLFKYMVEPVVDIGFPLMQYLQ